MTGLIINNGIKAIIDALPLGREIYLSPKVMPAVNEYLHVCHFGRFRVVPDWLNGVGHVFNIERRR